LEPLIGLASLVLAAIFSTGDTSASPAPAGLAPAADIGAGFTYQGFLQDNGVPVEGACDFSFAIYDAATEGNQLGATQEEDGVPVSSGRFTVQLDVIAGFEEPLFNGAERWLELSVRCPAGDGEYTTLAPRQALSVTPCALSLRPGAVISGTVPCGTLVCDSLNLTNASTTGLYVNSAGWYGVSVNSAGWDGVFVRTAGMTGVRVETAAQQGVYVGSAGANGLLVDSAAFDGIRVLASGSPSAAINSAAHNGFEVAGAEGNGLFVGQADVEGVHVQSAASNGLLVGAASADGVRVITAGSPSVTISPPTSNGIEVNGAEGSGLFVGRADSAGVTIASTGSAGLSINTAGTDGVSVFTAGNPGSTNASSLSNGFEVAGAEANGVRVGRADQNGVFVFSAGENGISINQAGDLAGFFNGNVEITGACTGCTLAAYGVNGSSRPLVPGDVVALQSAQAPDVALIGVPILIEVAPAEAGQPVVGVVAGRAELDAGGEGSHAHLVPREGPAVPGEYVTIIIYGLAQVQASAPDAPIAVGERLVVNDSGVARLLQTRQLDGMVVREGAPSLGIALQALPAGREGLIWILVGK